MTAYSITRVRRSLIYFSIGKVLGIVFGIGLLLILVRALDVESYKFYLLSLSLLLIIDPFSSLGLGAIAQRYIPELYSQSEGKKLSRLINLVCIFRIATLLLSILIIFIFAEHLAKAVNIVGMVSSLRLFLIVVLFELLARYLDSIFNSLLLQGIAQVSLLLRSGIRVVTVLWMLFSWGGPITLTTWILVDAVAAITGCIWGGIMLLRFLQKIKKEIPGKNDSLDYKRYFRYSMPFYLADNITTLTSRSVIKVIAAKVLNANQFASFGFAESLIAMLHRYLPMFLLINMIRPLFVSARQKMDYKTRIPELAELVLKLNMFTLVPIIAILAVYSDAVAIILTGGRYPDAGNYILAFLPILVTRTLRIIANLISQTMENSRAPLVATVLSVFGLLLGIILSSSIGVYGFCIGLALSDLIFTVWVLKAVLVNHLIFRIDWKAYVKLAVLTLMAMGMFYVVSNFSDSVSISYLLSYILVVVSMYLFFAYIIKPFTQIERDLINKIIKRKVFVW
jgi:O-antigen/teichoic acid export membrane protein